MDITNHVIIHPKLKPGSKDLVELFERFQLKGEIPLANDTSFGVGFAPFSDVETIVYELERALNSKEFKKEHPYVGEDIKIMGVRNHDNIRITIAMAFVDKYVNDIKDYVEKKEIVTNYAYSIAQRLTTKHVDIFINTADDIDNESVYITVTGTSAEAGDDGQVGRGNRVNGLITPYRPMSLEAAAGKNPVSHIGKIYNTAAMDMAERIVAEIEEVEEVYCYLVSQIGKPITEPQVCDVKLRVNGDLNKIKEKVMKIAQEELDKLPSTWQKFLNRHFRLY